MATRQPKQKTEIDDETLSNAIALLDDDSFSSETLNPALESLYAEMGILDGGEAQVFVTMLDADAKGAEANIWRGAPDDYDLERLAKTFGSGNYRVKIYVRNATGQRVLKGNKVFTWKLSPEDEERRKAPKVQEAAPFNPIELSRIIAESIKAAMPPPAPVVTVPPVDAMAQFKQFAEIMALMRPAEVAPAPAANTLSSLRDMAELVDMLRGDGGSAPAVGSATGNDLMLKLVDKFGPLLMNVLATQQQPGATAAIAAPVAQPEATSAVPQQTAVIAPAMPNDATPQPTQTQVDDVNIRLKMGINFLLQQCDAGGFPETYAEVVLDSVPPESVQMLVTNPNALDWLAQFDARVKNEPYAAWFTSLIAQCKVLTSDDEPTPGENNVPT